MPIGTQRPPGRSWDMKRKLFLNFTLSIAILGVSACGFGEGNGSKPGQREQSAIPDPRSLATPASQDGRFGIDPITSSETKPTGPFANVSPLEIRPGGSLGSLGLNLKTYMSGELNDPNARIRRLEDTVVAIHSDVATLAPAMQRMALIERDIEELIKQLEILLNEDGSAQTLPAMPAPAAGPGNVPVPLLNLEDQPIEEALAPEPLTAPTTEIATPQIEPAQKIEAPTPPPATTMPKATVGTSVTAVRIGQHEGRSRIVMDITGPVTPRVDLDNMERLLVVELPNVVWGTSSMQNFSGPLLQSLSTQALDNNGGTRAILVLKKESAILSQSVLKPGDGNQFHRLVIDLKN
jgi:hypothetical protein